MISTTALPLQAPLALRVSYRPLDCKMRTFNGYQWELGVTQHVSGTMQRRER